MKICVTCEKPLELKQDKESSKELQENRTSTPSNTVCMWCKSHCFDACLDSQFLRTTDQPGVYLLCSDCGRINAPDARFCDWCGKKVRKTSNSTIANCIV